MNELPSTLRIFKNSKDDKIYSTFKSLEEYFHPRLNPVNSTSSNSIRNNPEVGLLKKLFELSQFVGNKLLDRMLKAIMKDATFIELFDTLLKGSKEVRKVN